MLWLNYYMKEREGHTHRATHECVLIIVTIIYKKMYVDKGCFFVWIDSLHPSQQSFSNVGIGLLG